MSDLCNSPTATGHTCGYPPNACPLHIRVWPAPDAGEAPSDEFDPDDLAALSRTVIAKLTRGAITPLEAIRWLRALRSFHDLPVSQEDQEEVLKEIELRGVVMNGFPPRNEEEWALAREVLDDDAIAEFERWIATGHGW